MTTFTVPGPHGQPVTGTVTPGPEFGWRDPVIDWPAPDGSTVRLVIDFAAATVTVPRLGDVEYGDAWIANFLAAGARARARSGITPAVWRTTVAPSSDPASRAAA